MFIILPPVLPPVVGLFKQLGVSRPSMSETSEITYKFVYKNSQIRNINTNCYQTASIYVQVFELECFTVLVCSQVNVPRSVQRSTEVMYIYECSMCRYVRSNSLSVLHVPGPSFIAPNKEIHVLQDFLNNTTIYHQLIILNIKYDVFYIFFKFKVAQI